VDLEIEGRPATGRRIPSSSNHRRFGATATWSSQRRGKGSLIDHCRRASPPVQGRITKVDFGALPGRGCPERPPSSLPIRAIGHRCPRRVRNEVRRQIDWDNLGLGLMWRPRCSVGLGGGRLETCDHSPNGVDNFLTCENPTCRAQARSKSSCLPPGDPRDFMKGGNVRAGIADLSPEQRTRRSCDHMSSRVRKQGLCSTEEGC
jgi:hypothetical protein